MNDAEKLQMIAKIARLQADNQNDDEGDRYLADAYLAMEAVECVLAGNTTSGAYRQYAEA